MNRPNGTVEPLPSGRFRARLSTADGKRPSLGAYETHAEARAILDAALVELTTERMAPAGGVTLRAYAKRWLDRRERDGVRDVKTERYRWKAHLDTAPFADDPVASLGRQEVIAWVDAMRRKEATHYGEGLGRPLSRESVKKCLALLQRCLKAAMLDGVVKENVAESVGLWRSERTDEPWTYLEPDEQAALITCPDAAEPLRLIVAFAIGTGLRQGEQWNLELADVHVAGDRPHVVVRYGSKGKKTKSGKTRRIPLFGVGLDAARRWLEVLPGFAKKNPHRLAFPTERGARRQRSKTPKGWPELLAAACLGRHVRWHDLRHTCASSLVAGWWGRPWRLEEVRSMLGHSSITVTERYAHLGETALTAAAAATGGGPSGGPASTNCPRDPQGGDIVPVATALTSRMSQVQALSRPPSRNRLPNAGDDGSSGQGRGRSVDAKALLAGIAENRATEAEAMALVDSVLGRPEVALALACAEGGPLFWARVVALCERLLVVEAPVAAEVG
jgi:integrase